jgi:hypothetical protein
MKGAPQAGSTDAAQQPIGTDPESSGESHDGTEPGFASRSLEPRDLRGVEAALAGELVLGQAGSAALGPEVLRELLGGVHARILEQMGQ